jgi:hypothetical protein
MQTIGLWMVCVTWVCFPTHMALASWILFHISVVKSTIQMCTKQNKILPDLHVTKVVSIGKLLVVYVGQGNNKLFLLPFF